MIKVKCPRCEKTMKAKDRKEGMFDNCIHCGQRFQWKDTSKIHLLSDFESSITYYQFLFLLEHDRSFLGTLLREELHIAIGTRWLDNHVLEYYGHEQGDSGLPCDITSIFNKINEQRKDLCEKLYQRWMSLVH